MSNALTINNARNCNYIKHYSRKRQSCVIPLDSNEFMKYEINPQDILGLKTEINFQFLFLTYRKLIIHIHQMSNCESMAISFQNIVEEKELE